MPTLNLQPDASAGIDAQANQPFPNTNYGTSATLLVQGIADNVIKLLIKFDGISSIPSGATITSATLIWCAGRSMP
jgi:hypothetical protein